MTASQQIFKTAAPVKKRESRIWLAENRFDGKSNVGNVGVDHTELEGANNVAVARVHTSITAKTLGF
jgi:hypothetical protein